MKKYVNIYAFGIICFVCLFLPTCKPDKVVCQNCDKKEVIEEINPDLDMVIDFDLGVIDNCDTFPRPTQGGISTITEKQNQRHAPCFNPRNSAEFIYIKQEGRKLSLVKYNIDKKLEQILIDNTTIIGQPKWGKNGWIVFAQADFQIYLIKDNGDSLRKVTSFFENNNPSFIGMDRIYFSVGTHTVPGHAGNKIIDFWDKRIDSIKYLENGVTFALNDVNSRQEACGKSCLNSKNCYIAIRNLKDMSYSILNEFEFVGKNSILGIAWHPNNKNIYYSAFKDGLRMVNRTTKKVVVVRNACDSKHYTYLNISPDGKKIIVERVEATDFTAIPGSWTTESKIYMMDYDGKNEKNVFE